MDDLNTMLDDKKKYKNLKNNIKLIITQLNNVIDNLDVPSSRIKSLYTIDSISIDDGKLATVRQDLITRRNYLKNVVLVELNKELQEIEDGIESMG